MMNKLADLLNRPFIRFALSGGIAGLANILSRMALSQITNYSAAIVIAFLIGMTTAYVLMKQFVFQETGQRISHEYIRFGIVNMISLAQVWIISIILLKITFPLINNKNISETLSHSIAVFTPVITSYFLHKYFTFKSKGE